jgi:hypothetical protein
MTPDTTRSYSLLAHVVTVQGIETAPTLQERLDALLGPSIPLDKRQSGPATLLTVRREDDGWYLDDPNVDPRNGTACEPLRSEEQLAQHVEWLAYSATVRLAEIPLILHSGAVVRDGMAILLPNVSGAGKTTLTLALAARGWLPLTDDVCPVVERDGAMVAMGCRRCCHLNTASLRVLNALGVALEGPVGGLGFYYYRPLLWAEPAPVRGIVIPHYRADGPTTFAPITQAECMGQLTHMTFPQEAVPAYERRHSAARLAAQVPAFTLTYSALEEALDVFETLALDGRLVDISSETVPLVEADVRSST